nr:MAG TPA: helix-turn-helix XRE-family like protein [Siphoviridae sp. ct2wG4]DAI93624.1 MAG TPA: Helix-turn-helix XRE-family like protein [Caudoviricetes sp.]DAU49617.1 MAG TPA: Helix-turn-helix XRE-family like protein [Caudoviricetes sp.]
MYICIIIINISYMKYRIKELCKEKGITLESLALGIGTSQASISRIITGNGNPTMDSLERIAKFLNVEVPELFVNDGVMGFIKAKGQLFEINSISDIETTLETIKLL